jgi:uncharacterized protein
MAPFVATNKAPGVYIEEVQVPGPIAGVSTSIAAFIGPAEKGPIGQPTLLTNFTQFQNIFGGYISAPRVFVTHAVRGFFDNGGATCYFMRVGTAVQASLPLKDRSAASGLDTLVVKAKQEGIAGNNITVGVDDASITSPVLPLVNTQATLSSATGTTATVTVAADAGKFRVGDTVFLQQGTTSERAVIDKIFGTTITFKSALVHNYTTSGTIRIANLPSAQATLSSPSDKTKTATIGTAAGFQTGDIVFLQQGTTSERAEIENVSSAGTTITFKLNLVNSYPLGTLLRTADLIRVTDSTSVQPGDLLSLVQKTNSETKSEFVVVESVDLANKAIALRSPGIIASGLTDGYPMDQTVTVQPFVLVVRAQANLTAAAGNTATLANAPPDSDNFRVGDIVFLEQGATNDQAVISRIQAPNIIFQGTLKGTYTTGGTIRIANLAPPQRTFRVADATGLETGSYIELKQGSKSENLVVESVDKVGFVTVQTSGIQNTYSLNAVDGPVTVKSLEFSLTFPPTPTDPGKFSNLSMDPRHRRYFANVVDSQLVDVSLADNPPSPTPPPGNLPRTIQTSLSAGTPGQNDDLSAISATTYKTAIDALERVDDVSLLCIPDSVNQDLIKQNLRSFAQDVQKATIEHCEKMQDRFAILDPLPKLDPLAADGILGQRGTIASDGGYAALYYPQIIISNPVVTGRIQVPPSGHIAGVYARTDNTRGVHKAPANESMRGVLELEHKLSDGEQGLLNEQSINVLRSFPGSGIRIWGARTISTRIQWRYINVRRLLLFIEESIQEGTQFAVFEPNNLALWAKVKRQVTEFLTRVWQDGALFGATPDRAFRVRVDDELNPPSLRALGQLVIEVIVFPVTPAEFIVFRIIQKPGGGSFDEI